MHNDLVSVNDAPLGWRARRQLSRAHSAQLSAKLGVFEHGLKAWMRAEMDAQDSQALAEAMRASLSEEIGFLRDGLTEAGQSAAGVELVSRKTEIMASVNNRRIAQRFGA